MKEFTLAEAVKEYPEISLLAMLGGGKSTAGNLELIVCDYRKLQGFDPVLACEVRVDGNQISRFNVRP